MSNPAVPIPEPSRAGLAAVGLLLVVAGVALLAITFDVPWLRSTGLPAWPPMLAGCWVAAAAVRRDRRLATLLLAALTFGASGVFVWGFWIYGRMPTATAFEQLAQAPEFAVPDHNGTIVSLAELRARGPVHLVFYRGFW